MDRHTRSLRSLASRPGVTIGPAAKLPPPSELPARISEAAFQREVIRLAESLGWLVYHTHDSRRSNPGYPDLHLVRGKVSMFAELKADGGVLSAEQHDWIDALHRADLTVQVWWPCDWPHIVETLTCYGGPA